MKPAGIVLLAACVTSFGVGSAGVPQQPVFKTSVDLVQIDALVTLNGRPVTGLGPLDFEVTDNGVLQPLQAALPSGRLNVILALDVSGSVKGERLNALVQAVQALLGDLRDQEQVALVTFNDDIAVRSPLTPDVASVRRSLENIQPGGNTSMNDAVFAALSLGTRDARRLLVLFSDGTDNSSWLSGSRVIEAARRTDVVVCPVAVGLPARSTSRSARFLEALADRTGGRLFHAESIGMLRASMLEVLTEFRSRYVIAYTPTGVLRDDGWHHVEVRLKGRRAEIKAKDQYLAR